MLQRFADYKPLSEPGSGYAGARIAHADTIRFQIVPDPATAEAALATGGVDLLPSLAPGQIDQAKANGGTVETAQGLGWSVILVQTADPLLSDIRIRQAIAHALDLNQIAQARTYGLAEANPSAVARSSTFFDDSFLDWPAYDPAKAQALLQEAGYKGQPITIQTNKRYDGMYDNAVMIQAMLAAAGIDARLEVLDWATQLDNYTAGKFQLQSFSFSARLDPSLLYGILIGSKAKNPARQWDDPKAAELLAQSIRTEDAAKRKDALQAAARADGAAAADHRPLLRSGGRRGRAEAEGLQALGRRQAAAVGCLEGGVGEAELLRPRLPPAAAQKGWLPTSIPCTL